ncbi:Leukocyte receptor cluster member 1 [Pseudolycoriella hygida]|uniref:Leukocyte receptor cluster member 1 n=1 Tax=Pseudolycoriella hygida TaxID=35572 RepID=A0A9Q0MY95_9DIPT|nr:Leukocyte receptor cluster member 1 [Pseudolycoriella hygida]
MNILHHKSWHVRNKDNIARVRRDEAKAKAEQDEKDRKIALAEQEVKLNFLRKRAETNSRTQTVVREDQSKSDDNIPKHINFFADLEDGTEISGKGNEKYLKDKKDEQEKYEKQIGYLTYLGQDTNESLGKRDWYDVAPKRVDAHNDRGEKVEVGLKAKNYNDPLNVMKKYIMETEKLHKSKDNPTVSSADHKNKCKPLFPSVTYLDSSHQKHHKKKSKKPSKSKKHKKEKSRKRSRSRSPRQTQHSAEKIEKLLRLRAERLKREEVEKNRAKLLLAKYNVVDPTQPKEPTNRATSRAPSVVEPMKVKQKYNSQFNPEIAKQNYEDMRSFTNAFRTIYDQKVIAICDIR